MQRHILYTIAVIAAMIGFNACIEDGISTSAADQPAFSTDTLKMGVVFTDEVTMTHRLTVYNRHSKGMLISDIHLEGEGARDFRINVDGATGETFQGIEVRAKDSIFVMVEATLPARDQDQPQDVNADLCFTVNGVRSTVVLNATGQDVKRLRAVTYNSDTRLTAGRPYQVYDSLVVAEGATLTLEPGTDLRFHDGASLIVRGTLLSQGTVDNPINIAGDRTGNVITDITFDLMSRQWRGVQFAPSSRANVISHTCIRNTDYGVIVNGGSSPRNDGDTPMLTIVNSRLRNSGDRVLEAYHANITAIGCEFAEASNGLVLLHGGKHVFNHCTFANYYLFSAIYGPALAFEHLNADNDDSSKLPYTAADITNSILYGNGSMLSHGDLTGTKVFLRRVLIKENGSDDANFIACLWDKDPLYYTVREDYIFDYRLKPESPAIGAGDASLMLPAAARDAYGLPRQATAGAAPDLGAYVYVAPKE